MVAKKRAPRGELLAVASDVVWRYRVYDAYGRDLLGAGRALKRRCPGFSARQYENALAKALDLYEAVQVLLRARRDEVWAAYEAKQPWHELFDDELRTRFPGFRKSTLGSVVGMSFFYWYLK